MTYFPTWKLFCLSHISPTQLVRHSLSKCWMHRDLFCTGTALLWEVIMCSLSQRVWLVYLVSQQNLPKIVLLLLYFAFFCFTLFLSVMSVWLFWGVSEREYFSHQLCAILQTIPNFILVFVAKICHCTPGKQVSTVCTARDRFLISCWRRMSVRWEGH